MELIHLVANDVWQGGAWEKEGGNFNFFYFVSCLVGYLVDSMFLVMCFIKHENFWNSHCF